jgi:Flp pilus assembly protein TadB
LPQEARRWRYATAMADDAVPSEKYLPWIFLLAGVVMLVVGVAQLFASPEVVLLGWVVIACGIFNLIVAGIYLRRPRR